ncbi:MAG TPA: FAD binding domain-containing protein, partial [Terriglobales bacterium]
MTLPAFQLLRPENLDQVVSLLARRAGDLKVIAGGTDLLPSMRQKLFTPPFLLDLRGVDELRGIRTMPDGSVSIGALTTLAEIEHSALIRR